MPDTNRPRPFEWGLFCCTLVTFVALLVGVIQHAAWINTFDQALIKVIRFPQTPWKNQLIKTYTTLFNPVPLIVMILVGVFILFMKHYYWATFFFLFTTVAGTIANSVIKSLVQRPRPTVTPLMHYGGYSFPSGHSSGSMLVLGCVIVLITSFVLNRWRRRLLKGLGIILILLVGYSRIYVGVHYPSDVLAGFCLGYFTIFIGQTIFSFHHRKSSKKGL